MKIKVVLVVMLLLVVLLFLFRGSGYTEPVCTSDNPEFTGGKRCYDSNGKINIAGPFCKEECKGTWK